MFGFIWGLTASMHYAVRRFLPTNIALDAIHSRRGLKWGVPAMLIALPYLLAAAFCVGLVEDGGAGWLSLLALLFVWNALKFIISGPATLVRLVLARHREARARRLSIAELDGMGDLDRVERPTRAFVRS
jgi:hypothetical protein